MRVYQRAMGATTWTTLEEYMDGSSVVWYGAGAESASDYPWLAGHWLSDLAPLGAGQMLYQDAFGLWVGRDFGRVGGDFGRVAVPKRVPEYLAQVSEVPWWYFDDEDDESETGIRPYAVPIIIIGLCLVACAGSLASLWNAYQICANNPPPTGCKGAPHWICWVDCLLENGCGGPVSLVLCLGCALCICVAVVAILRIPPKVCKRLADVLKKITKPNKTRITLDYKEKWEGVHYA